MIFQYAKLDQFLLNTLIFHLAAELHRQMSLISSGSLFSTMSLFSNLKNLYVITAIFFPLQVHFGFEQFILFESHQGFSIHPCLVTS